MTSDSAETREEQSGNPLRTAFGVLLFAAWCVATAIWVASTVYLAGQGNASAVISAVIALALIMLLAVMEGLRYRSSIDGVNFPRQTTAVLGGWLSARQLFVAMIVTSATLLAHRATLIIPFTSTHITNTTLQKIFDVTWTGFTVLWFAQILPKVLAATDPTRYLRYFRTWAFPVVEIVRVIGFSQPGEWAASLISRRFGWVHRVAEEEEPSLEIREEPSLARGWRSVITR
jgi:hypothetical protein